MDYYEHYLRVDTTMTLLMFYKSRLKSTPKWRLIKRAILRNKIIQLKLDLNSIYGVKSCGTTLDKH